MRYFFYFIVVALLFGCGPNFLNQQVRPDDLSFPPLEFSFPEVA